MKPLRIADKIISETSPVFVIAEIGINHNGDIKLAKQLIDMAVMVGADAVKFQKRTPELCVPKAVRNKKRDTPWGEMTYFEYKKRIEFGEKEFKEIDRYCREKGILWGASAWDIPSVNFLESFNVAFHKIPSAKLTDKALLLRIRKTKKPVIFSVGMSTEEEIMKAAEIFGETWPVAILHCNSSYPAKYEDLNLAYIQRLKMLFPNHIIGYSGHEVGLSPSLIATVLGAKIVERHITLDRAIWGTDQAASVEIQGMQRLIRDIRAVPVYIGDGVKRVTESEKPILEKLRDKNTL